MKFFQTSHYHFCLKLFLLTVLMATQMGAICLCFAQIPVSRPPDIYSSPRRDELIHNQRDVQETPLTPIDLSENDIDIALIQKIRQDLMADSSLSILAKNINIIAIQGNVTLSGLVSTQQEKDRIEIKVLRLIRPSQLTNLIEVKNP